MNIDNVALVRAMEILPLNGELIPSCEDKYLKRDKSSNFVFVIRKLVKKELEAKLGRPLNLYDSEDSKLFDNIMTSYYPLTSSYTSTLSFALNGLVPDDINNKFSEMKIAVIEPLKEHTNAEFLNISVIDTTTKGRIKLSNSAILVIDNSLFNSLSEEIKINLMSNYKIELFEGSLKEAVNSTLVKYNYPSLNLTQKREENYISDCPEKENMQQFQDTFAKTVGASRLRLAQLYMEPFLEGVDLVAGEKAKGDFYKNIVVEDYYKEQLYQFLIMKAESFGIPLSDEEKYYLFSEYSNSEEVLEKLIINLITTCGGLENFQSLIGEYNQNVIENYLTNDQIIALKGESRE